MKKILRSLRGIGLVVAALSLTGCATEDLYGPPPPGYYADPPGWYDGYGYGYGMLDVGGYYGGGWDHNHHWHAGEMHGGHGGFRGGEAHPAGFAMHGGGGGARGGGGHGGGGHR